MASARSSRDTVAGEFGGLTSLLDAPMFIVTAHEGGERAGCLVGFATQVSIRPPRFLVGISDKNRTYRIARGTDRLAVHFVPAEATALAELFGGRTGDETDKFASCAWHEGPGGLPLLDDCPNRFVGEVVERVPFGDHVGFVLEPVAVERGGAGRQFTFHRATRIEAGHEA